ncbi:hypothetical protein [Pseudomonas sp. B392_1p]|jgi:hypothetical protein|uniref:Uncharacterized protein n=1 Tax=Serpens gallinarum TaxID=2763075 RepID=A0ABR8TMR8_9PSED|nr:hypothetical protein [Serpens gallinarum]
MKALVTQIDESLQPYKIKAQKQICPDSNPAIYSSRSPCAYQALPANAFTHS